MFTLIFIAVISAIVIYYVRKSIKPKGLENVPFVSVLPLVWAYIQGKYYDEIADLIYKISGGHDIYLVRQHYIYCILVRNNYYYNFTYALLPFRLSVLK